MRWMITMLILGLGVTCAFYASAQDTPSAPPPDVTVTPYNTPRLHIGPLITPLDPDPTPAPAPTVPPTSAPAPAPAKPVETLHILLPSSLDSQAPPLPPDVTPATAVNPQGPSLRDSIKAVSPGYVIRTGDQIHFHILDEDDMDLLLRVGKDGTVHIPYLTTPMLVGGKTISQALDDITKALRVYYISPIVSLELTEFAQNSFTILGQVNAPGVIVLPPQVESIGLMDAIARANGTNAIADMGNVTVKRIVNGAEEVIHVDGRPIARGEPGKHFEVLAGDTVIVALTNNQFKVLGDVRNPGIFTLPPLTDSLDLGDALAMAGSNSTDLGEVTIKRVVDGRETVISLDKATMRGYSRNEKSGDHFFVLSGDTIEVKDAKSNFIILGQVRSPGIYQIPSQQDSISILEALAMAGGATRLGDLGHVLVRRKVNGTVENMKINVKEIQNSDTQQIFQVLPEDTISIGERMF